MIDLRAGLRSLVMADGVGSLMVRVVMGVAESRREEGTVLPLNYMVCHSRGGGGRVLVVFLFWNNWKELSLTLR
jgi:hypothetical protein